MRRKNCAGLHHFEDGDTLMVYRLDMPGDDDTPAGWYVVFSLQSNQGIRARTMAGPMPPTMAERAINSFMQNIDEVREKLLGLVEMAESGRTKATFH